MTKRYEVSGFTLKFKSYPHRHFDTLEDAKAYCELIFKQTRIVLGLFECT